MRTQGTVDDWFVEQTAWAAEVAALRAILRGCGLEEALKWRQPCYVDQGQNIAILSTMKDCCAVNFFKGALVEDPDGYLEVPGENSRSARYMRFSGLADIQARTPALERLLQRAIAVERAGLRVAPLAEEAPPLAEIQALLDADPAVAAAFAALTPGRRRAYNIVVGGAKSSSARAARVERFLPRILAGKGPNDCICGHTNRPPNCDGSHKLHGVADAD